MNYVSNSSKSISNSQENSLSLCASEMGEAEEKKEEGKVDISYWVSERRGRAEQSQRSFSCVHQGVCRQVVGKRPPSLDKGRRWLALLKFGVGWCKQTPSTERRALPWSSFQLPTEWDGRQWGPAYNKKGLETLHPLHPKTSTPPHHWPVTLPPHQVTCTATKVGGML